MLRILEGATTLLLVPHTDVDFVGAVVAEVVAVRTRVRVELLLVDPCLPTPTAQLSMRPAAVFLTKAPPDDLRL